MSSVRETLTRELVAAVDATVGATARPDLTAEVDVLERAAARGLAVHDRLERNTRRLGNIANFADAYRGYVWPTEGLTGVSLAPFQVLATPDEVMVDRPHDWHLSVADRLVEQNSALFATTRRTTVDLDSEESVRDGARWRDELTSAGGQGLVGVYVEATASITTVTARPPAKP